MRATLLIILCAFCLSGCATARQNVRLSRSEREQLYTAVDQWATFHLREEWPPEIRRLRPISVYIHISNVAIALSRDAHTERGYYIIPTCSSNRGGDEPTWKFKDFGHGDEGVFEYERRRESNAALEPYQRIDEYHFPGAIRR